MGGKFEMDPQAANAGLSCADTTTAAQPSSTVTGARPGGYAAPLLSAIVGTRTMRQAEAEVRAVGNTISREVSVAAVESAEEADSGALST